MHYYTSRSRACEECVRGATPIDETHLPDKTWMHSTSYRWVSSWSPAEVAKENKSKKSLRIDDLNLLFFVNMARWILPPEEWRRVRQLQLLRRCDHSNADSATTIAGTHTVCGLASNDSTLRTSAPTMDTDARRPPAGHPVSLESTTSPNLKGLSTTTWFLQQALDRTDPSPPTTRS